MRIVLVALLLGGCWRSTAAPPIANQEPEPKAPAASDLRIRLGNTTWTIAISDGSVRASRDDRQKRHITSRAFDLDVSHWPRSDAFVQTLKEHIEWAISVDSKAEIVHQRDGGDRDFEAVIRLNGKLDGTLLKAIGDDDGAFCSFEIELDQSWRGPMAACRSLRPAPVLEDSVH